MGLSASSGAYRLYTLNHLGRIVSVLELRCEGDDAATEAARACSGDHALELWDGSRLIWASPRRQGR